MAWLGQATRRDQNMTTTTTGVPARRRAWRGTRLGWLGLLPAAGVLLATVAAAPASAGSYSHPAGTVQQAGHHRTAASAPVTVAQAPAGLRAAVRATLGQPATAPVAPATRAAPASLVPGDGQADFFGVSIAISGNTALVGATTAHHRTGAAYVFTRGNRGWTQQARLVASDGVARDNFGFSVALSGNTALVGAPNRGIRGIPISQGMGAAYVFTRTGTTWTQQALLTRTTDSSSSDFFGFSVALSGQTALVGVPGDGGSRGAVFAFTRTGTTWIQQSEFTGSNSEQENAFGSSVAFSGHTAVVGAPQQGSVKTGAFTGEAYVFTQTATGFRQQAILRAPHRLSGDVFGRSVALSGTTALVGAPGVAGFAGAAYVFTRTATGWARQATLTAADGQPGESLALNSLAISGNTAVVGEELNNSFAGAAYEFVRTGTTWAQKAKFTDPGGAPNDRLGRGVAISGTTALVGAPGHNNFHGQVDLFPL
jgi:hypothetical protein